MEKYVTIIIPSLSFGGAEKVTVNLIREFSKDPNLFIDLILLKYRDCKTEEDTNKILRSFSGNVRVLFTNSVHISRSIPFLLRYFYLNKHRKILTVLNSVNSVVLFCKILYWGKLDVCITIHDNFVNELTLNRTLKNKVINLFVKYAYKNADSLIAVSDGIKNNLISQYHISEHKIVRIYNPILDNFKIPNTLPTHKWIQSGVNKYKIIIGVGSLRIQKNFKLLIDAFSIVIKKRPDARLIILGEGELRHELEYQISSLNLSAYVDLHGYTSNVYEFLKIADLFVSSSQSEALPTVLIEALAANLPIVATDCDFGPREILKDGQYGMLVPVNDKIKLADAILFSLVSNSSCSSPDLRQYYLPFAANQYKQVLFGND